MEKKKALILIILLSIFGVSAAQNEISNVRVQVVDTIVVITYDLEIKADIDIFISLNNDDKFLLLKEVEGEVGKDIMPKKNKIIIWNAVMELGYVDYPNAVIKVAVAEKNMIAEQNIEKQMKSYEEINKMRSKLVANYFKENVEKDIYTKFAKGRDQQQIGIAFISITGLFAIGGVALPSLFIACGCLLIPAITLCAVGANQKRTAKEEYRNRYFGNTYSSSYTPSLNINFTGNGLGLRLNF